jgi:hypothetical protein
LAGLSTVFMVATSPGIGVPSSLSLKNETPGA